jgi:drug/metabolite transporter (DMT)-like permease
MPSETIGRSYGALTVGVVAIAWSAIFVRWAQMPGITSAFYRMLIASVALWPVLLLSKVKLSNVSRSAFLLTALSGVFFAGDVGLFNTAVMHTSAGSATFLGNNAPLVVGLLTWAATRKMPSGRFWTALAIGSSGAWLIVSVDAHHAASEYSADLLAVGASICFALYLLATERLRKDIDTRVLVTISASSSAVVLLVVAAVAHVSLAVPSAESLAAVLGLGLVCAWPSARNGDIGSDACGGSADGVVCVWAVRRADDAAAAGWGRPGHRRSMDCETCAGSGGTHRGRRDSLGSCGLVGWRGAVNLCAT